jgi:preprotein translocase subunit SecA
MRIFGSERMDSMLQRLGLKDGEAIIHPWVNKALAKAQQKVEARNYDIRKQLLKFDDVMNDQRKVVYEQRRDIMNARDVATMVADMRNDSIADAVALAIPENTLPEQWDLTGLHAECLRLVALDLPLSEWAKEDGADNTLFEERVIEAAERKMAEKTANYGPELMRMAEKSLLLQLLDQTWKDHLLSLDHLRQGINLRAYAQRDPLNEYKREAFELFEEMLVNLRQQVTSVLSHVELRMEPPPPPQPAYGEMVFGERASADHEMALADAGVPAGLDGGAAMPPGRARSRRGNGHAAGNSGGVRERAGERAAAAVQAPWAGTARNAACPCGSGKKFKHCHGRI